MGKKLIFVIIFIIIFAIIFTGYLHEQDIDDLAYVIAIGLDKSENDKLLLSIQVAIPSENGSSSSSSSSSDSSSSSSENESSDTLVKTVECNSFNSGISLVNNSISKKINLSHCKFIVFSESLAKEGIEEYIYTLENNLELRSNCHILVTESKAEEFLNNSDPIFESSTSKYYEVVTTTSKHTRLYHRCYS